MNRSTSILTIFAAVTLGLAATGCAPQLMVTDPSTPPATTVPVAVVPSAMPPTAPVPNIPPVGIVVAPPPALATPSLTEPTAEPTDIAPGGASSSGDAKTITLDDQGKTIQLVVGDSFLLKLGEQFDWAVTISDQNVVSRVKNIAVVRGAQGVYDALQPGTVTLTATGDPPCRQSKPPCMAPSLLFTVTIVVK